VLTPELEQKIVDTTVKTRPGDGSTHWSVRMLARQLRVSRTIVHRVWQRHDLLGRPSGTQPTAARIVRLTPTISSNIEAEVASSRRSRPSSSNRSNISTLGTWRTGVAAAAIWNFLSQGPSAERQPIVHGFHESLRNFTVEREPGNLQTSELVYYDACGTPPSGSTARFCQ
jgi:hypothetical protein